MPPSGASRVGASSGTANRVQFNPAIDLEMLSYVRNANTFRDQKEWTHIAAKMQDLTRQSFTSRTVRERTYLLLGRFIAKDRVALRKSGTEEEYGQREALLQEILDLARESGVKIPVPRKANAVSAQQPEKSRNCPTVAAARHSAALARDAAAEHYIAGNTVGDASKRRNQKDVNYAFLEKRMRHDLLMKEKDFALESRRLSHEEERLVWEKERTVNEGRLVALLDDTRRQLAEQWAEERRLRAEEREKERRERAEEREMVRKERVEERALAAAQQESLTRIIEKELSRIK
ncbi:hypothetical protein HPB50_009880 [Hyalomma asiaticum]|uniref:Uncharacterized protein n=1 Tax=Hyalomma asiaticum TaxID=266040 RepID=A0ACB7RSW5_HYAAI|nr:hypothetical protein HPB50_009880 [Hyalomma asiaticum]